MMERLFYFICTIGAFYLIILSFGWSFFQKRWIVKRPFVSTAIVLASVLLSWIYIHFDQETRILIAVIVLFPILIFYLVRLSKTAK
jgi:hypothetical protein